MNAAGVISVAFADIEFFDFRRIELMVS